MIVPISKVKFVNKAEIVGPKYFKGDLTELQKKGAVDMIQIPGIYLDDPKAASKIVVGITEEGKIMNGKNDIAAFPCPPACHPPVIGGLTTLSSFLG